jgi:hypothetical protein
LSGAGLVPALIITLIGTIYIKYRVNIRAGTRGAPRYEQQHVRIKTDFQRLHPLSIACQHLLRF